MDRLEILVKCGGISSVIGVAMMTALVIVLLAYPVSKHCDDKADKCEFISQSPEPLRLIVQPVTLVISMACIAAGILLLRLGMWRRSRKIAN